MPPGILARLPAAQREEGDRQRSGGDLGLHLDTGVPTPTHFHDKDVVVTYLEDGALRSTDPGGTSVVNEHYFGFTKLNSRDRVHTEELVSGQARAIIVELK